MILNPKTLEKLRLLINEDTEYRSAPQLVQFFNALGFNYSYGQSFPFRWIFTDKKLKIIHGSPEIDKSIKTIISSANFIEQVKELDGHIAEFNKYMAVTTSQNEKCNSHDSGFLDGVSYNCHGQTVFRSGSAHNEA